MTERRDFHMTPEQFRHYGHAVVDWVASYLERVEDLPTLAQVSPGDIRARLPAAAPEHGEPFADVLADLDEVILPGLTHWQSPNFFGFFPANASGPSVLGELVSAGLGVQGMLWLTSPAATELEQHILDWLVDLLGLPQRFRTDHGGGGVIQDSASSATLCALIAARERATAGAANVGGVDRPLAVYASTQAHSSVEKAVRVAGLGSAHFRPVGVDEHFSLRPDELAGAIAADRAAGVTPCLVVATVGTTSSLALDPLAAIGEITRREGIWLHVDAAMAGSAAVCPEFRFIHDGLEHADSYCFNPHKWLFTNFDCDAFFVADPASLVRALSIQPEYLRNVATESGAVVDYRDWQIPLGRRFRALKLWFVLRWYGAEGLRHHIRRHVELAQEFAAWIADDPRFALVTVPTLNLVCLRHVAGDDATQRLMEAVNRSGRAYLTHTRLAGRFVIRVSIGQTHTERRHVEALWRLMTEAAAELGW